MSFILRDREASLAVHYRVVLHLVRAWSVPWWEMFQRQVGASFGTGPEATRPSYEIEM